MSTFPCCKLSLQFPSVDSLSSKVNTYNKHFKSLSFRLNFSVLDLSISEHRLSNEGLPIHHSFLSMAICDYINHLIHIRLNHPLCRYRSQADVIRQDTQRHDKLKEKQHPHTTIRSISEFG